MLLILSVCLVLIAPISANQDQSVNDLRLAESTSKNELCLARSFDWISNKVLGVIDTFIPDERTGRSSAVEGRKHKHKFKKGKLGKYLFPLIIGLLLIKSIIVPLILKALAILSGKAILLSLLSLILSAIIGLKHIAYGRNAAPQNKVDVLTVPVGKYRRKDHVGQEEPIDDEQPYRYYVEKRKRRKR